MAPKAPSPTSRLRFLALPPELRLQVYDNYFSSYSRPDAEDIHEETLPRNDKHTTLPLLLVSKQVSEEVLDLLRKRKQHVYSITGHNTGFDDLGITGQNAGFDDLALSCLRARKIKCDDYANIPHLRIEIGPPHPERSLELMHILYCVQELCKRLGAIDRLQHVSIVFLETEIAGWSADGELRMAFREWQDEPDLKYVLELFATLNNVTEATVELPRSVAEDVSVGGQSVRGFAARLEGSMMGLDSLDHWSGDMVIEVLDCGQGFFVDDGLDQEYEGLTVVYEGLDDEYEGLDDEYEGLDHEYEGLDHEYKVLHLQPSLVRPKVLPGYSMQRKGLIHSVCAAP